jgi:hypothetical protein
LLGAITVDRSHGQLHVEQEVIQIVSLPATVDKDDGSDTGHLGKKTKEKVSLLMSFSLDDNLLDVLGGASSTANSEANVRSRKVLLREISSGLGKGSGEKTELHVAFILFCQAVLVHGWQTRV